MSRFLLPLLLALACAAPAAEPPAGGAPWPAPIPTFVAPQPGEHPRLFFRKPDLAALRQKAQTPQGQEIVRRLRTLLGHGGEALPSAYQESTEAYQNKSKNLPLEAYTLWHAAGFGMLYQLTGEKKYADLGRQCVEKAFAGQRDRDDRYSWVHPGGFLRAGPSVAAIAMAYDWCYDGWEPAYRQKIAAALLHYDGGRTDRDGGGQQTLERLALKPQLIPASNHWGCQVGGASLSLLAVRGDPGVDSKDDIALTNKYLAGCEKNMLIELTEGWGDHGQFGEGDGPATIAADTGMVPALQVWKVAGGKDFIAPRPNGQWMTLKWMMQSLPNPGAAHFPKDAWYGALAEAKVMNPENGIPAYPYRGNYPQNIYSRTGQSGSGAFAQGFGAVEEKYRPGLLWTFNHAVCPKESDYDAVSYPHRAALALVNWPFGVQEVNPGTLLPTMIADEKYGLFVFRNEWKDENDIIVNALPADHRGYHPVKGGDIMVWAFKQKALFPGPFAGKYKSFKPGLHGGVVNLADSSLGVDFSKASGAEAVVVVAGEQAKKAKAGSAGTRATQVIQAEGTTFAILTLSAAARHPEAKAAGAKVTLGAQTIGFQNGSVGFEP